MSKRDELVWPQGQSCAVSLTYDDGLPVHYDLVGPLLAYYGLRGTFFVPAVSDVRVHPERWRLLARRGHELGNHSLFHPCTRLPGREGWLEAWHDLRIYTLHRLREELATANLILQLLDGQSERTYGNTCCETEVGHDDARTSMAPVLQELFLAARGPLNGRAVDVRRPVDLHHLGHSSGDGVTFETIKAEIEKAAEIGGWSVWMMHGVGSDTHGLYIEPAEHEKLVQWLGTNKELVWTAPLIKVAQHVAHQQA